MELLQQGSFALVPTGMWVILISTMLLSLLPSPLQPFLRSLFLRGKTLPSDSAPSKFVVPQSYFLHFYIVGCIFNGLLSLAAVCYVYANWLLFQEIQGLGAIFVLLLFELHVLRRLLESIYIANFSSTAQMHLFAYIIGLIYYILTPLSIFPRAIEVVSWTFKLRQHDFKRLHGLDSTSEVSSSLLLRLGRIHWVAGFVFIWGWIHQYRCHMILASLRSKKESDKDVNRIYKIPYGDWFEYVSSAHYLSEIVMYMSFVIAYRGQNLDVWLLFVFVVINLSIAAIDTHKWYKRKFEEYPPTRRAIIPFIL